MKREFRLPTLVGLLVATAGLVSGLVLLREPIGQRLQASAEETPREVKVTNISDVGFVVSWITDKAVAGYVQYGEGEAGGQLAGSDERDQEKGWGLTQPGHAGQPPRNEQPGPIKKKRTTSLLFSLAR